MFPLIINLILILHIDIYRYSILIKGNAWWHSKNKCLVCIMREYHGVMYTYCNVYNRNLCLVKRDYLLIVNKKTNTSNSYIFLHASFILGIAVVWFPERILPFHIFIFL